MQPQYLSVLTPDAAKFNRSIGRYLRSMNDSNILICSGAYVRFDDEPFVDATNFMLLQNPDGASSWILAVVRSL
jgi:hypothetical protein